MVTKHVLEVRYRPTAELVDHRGKIADKIAEDFFHNWQISDNRIDFSTKDNKDIRAYFSFKNFGLESDSPNSSDFFESKGDAFIGAAWEHLPTKIMTRLGVRSRFYMEHGDFEALFTKFRDDFLNPSLFKKGGFGGNLVDLGFPLNFEDGEGNRFDTTFGPMRKEQAKSYFANEDLLSEAGLFIDVDFYKKWDGQAVRLRDLRVLFSQGIERGESFKDSLVRLIS